MEILKRVVKRSLIVLIIISVLSVFFFDWKIPLSILLGGALGIVNLKGLIWSTEGLLHGQKAKIAIVFSSLIRLFILFLIIFLLIKFDIANIFGLLVGLSVIFFILPVEGFLSERKKID
ncbi:MAG TPA: hypothetical protein DEP99_01740 [Nitrospiraceae bacterium]|nr:hypothetical protein [Nitrospiraceae bacterium]